MTKNVTIAMPRGVREKLKILAAVHGLTMREQLAHLIEEASKKCTGEGFERTMRELGTAGDRS